MWLLGRKTAAVGKYARWAMSLLPGICKHAVWLMHFPSAGGVLRQLNGHQQADCWLFDLLQDREDARETARLGLTEPFAIAR